MHCHFITLLGTDWKTISYLLNTINEEPTFQNSCPVSITGSPAASWFQNTDSFTESKKRLEENEQKLKP